MAKSGRGDLDEVERGNGVPLMIREEGEGGPEPGPERRRHLGRIGRHDGELAVVDRELVLKLREVP
jgi:hypothetical protein